MKQNDIRRAKKCNHKWKEDEIFACGAVTMITGSSKDLGEETRLVCEQCGESKYVRTKDLGSILDIYKSTTKGKI